MSKRIPAFGTIIFAALAMVACAPLAAATMPTAAPTASPTKAAMPAATTTTATASALSPAPSATEQAAAVTPAAQAGATAATAGSVVSTTVIVFQPAGTTGADRSGDCWTTSVPVSRPGAWRCRIGNEIHDPCFSTQEDSSAVICDADPTKDGKGFKMNLTQPLPTETPVPQQGQHVWVMQLADGTVCSAFQGARFPVEGEIATYGCNDRSVIAGDPKEGKVWTVKKVQMSADNRTVVKSEKVAVKTVWQ